MPRRVRIRVGDVVAEATLYDDAAPRTTAALWDRLPISDRTIQTRWSGDAWRTEGNHELLPDGTPVENVAGHLSAGDMIYYPGYRSQLIKVGIAYGQAQWLAPFCVPIDVALIGKIDMNLDAFVARCSRIIFEGPLEVEISRIEA
ncbi:MAG TPA: DUF3830 family protein [Thermomicrobiaceae bacterium]|nr:DUF3830 family protein [Thermomicrobiaceae bacterium]